MEENLTQGTLESVGLIKKPTRKPKEQGKLAKKAKPGGSQREEWQNEWS